MTRTNKILLVVLLVLLSAFALTKVFRSPSLESNFNADVFKVDTAEIATVSVYVAANEGRPITLKKGEGTWTVEDGTQTANLASTHRDALLRTLATINAERIVSRNEEKWDTYQVGDSTGTQVVIADGAKNELAHWYIGKQSQGATYARRDGETEVYALNGYLQSEFDKDFDDWRDKTFLEVETSSVEKIMFAYPADSSFVLEKKANGWVIGNAIADSAKVERYLGRLRAKDLTAFADHFSPETEPDITLTITAGTTPAATVKGWKTDGDKWVLGSSFQEGVYFSDSTFVDDLFIGKAQLAK